MKRKAIEKIPWLTLPRVIRKKEVQYVGVTAIQEIEGEKHLILEMYQNSRTTRKIPVVRIVVTEKDFGNYFPGKEGKAGEWTRQKICSDSYYNDDMIWSRTREFAGKEAVQRNILMSGEDLERIREICPEKRWSRDKWWEYIHEKEDCITRKARIAASERKRQRRQQALQDRKEHTGELPAGMILERADHEIFREKHYLYYKKQGIFAKIACSKCGGVSDGRWKDGISYESQYQRWVENPKEGQIGTCPLCGDRGEYKCQGKMKGEYRKTAYLFLGQKYREKGMVLRFVEVEKIWRLGLICGEKGPEMYNAYEELSGVEVARAYFLPGQKMQMDYQNHSYYTGEDFWEDCNLYGNASIRVGPALILRETYEEMKGTMFQYSALQEYAETQKECNPIDYLERYQKTPQIEMLVKLGMTKVAEELVRGRNGIVEAECARRPDLFLGIRKEHVKLLMEKRGDLETLEVLKMERRMGARWTAEQIENLKEMGIGRGALETALQYMGIQQFLNRIRKYAGCEYGTGCSTAEARLQQTALQYGDYLNMRQALGYDLTNTVYQQPRDLGEAHQKMVQEINRTEADKRLAEVKVMFQNIRKNYRRLRNRFYYEDDEFLIRPARSAEEIVTEGRILHHCVGGNNYLRKHNDGESYILMLRKKEDPEEPYITVEIDAEGRSIRQWYGAHDRKPDQERMNRWLDAYLVRRKCSGKEADEEAAQRVLITA